MPPPPDVFQHNIPIIQGIAYTQTSLACSQLQIGGILYKLAGRRVIRSGVNYAVLK